jgi:hypothetical protein
MTEFYWNRRFYWILGKEDLDLGRLGEAEVLNKLEKFAVRSPFVHIV